MTGKRAALVLPDGCFTPTRPTWQPARQQSCVHKRAALASATARARICGAGPQRPIAADDSISTQDGGGRAARERVKGYEPTIELGIWEMAPFPEPISSSRPLEGCAGSEIRFIADLRVPAFLSAACTVPLASKERSSFRTHPGLALKHCIMLLWAGMCLCQ